MKATDRGEEQGAQTQQRGHHPCQPQQRCQLLLVEQSGGKWLGEYNHDEPERHRRHDRADHADLDGAAGTGLVTPPDLDGDVSLHRRVETQRREAGRRPGHADGEDVEAVIVDAEPARDQNRHHEADTEPEQLPRGYETRALGHRDDVTVAPATLEPYRTGRVVAHRAAATRSASGSPTKAVLS